MFGSSFLEGNTPAEEMRKPSPPVIGVTGRKEDREQWEIPAVLPILPVRNMVVFPGTIIPLTVGRASSRKLLDDTLAHTKVIGVMTQRRAEEENPGREDLYTLGVAVAVLKLLRQEDKVLVVLQALRRIRLRELVQHTPFLKAEVEVVGSTHSPMDEKEWEATVRNLRETASKLVEATPDLPAEAGQLLGSIEDPGLLADFLASNLNLEVPQKQDLLEELDVVKRVRGVQLRLSGQLEILELQRKIQKDVASQLTDAQRRVYLREQIKAIQKELGEESGGIDEQVELLRRKLDDAQAPEGVMQQGRRELNRLSVIPPASPEFSVIVSYLETLADLPWAKMTPDKLELKEAREILDRDHYDLEKVKRRLIEYLAVRKLNPTGRGPILCFLGPPGVGKTSLGESIADALGRKFSRISLGGLRDESEIRGHRRTYIGSMPGRIIQELRRLGTRNPVLMLDEVDKIGADFRGDPASALLEVLDPRQNHAFVDRFIDVPFDLSQVIFIATANYMDPVPAPLRDRMEVLEIPGYTEHEKLQIARRYLVRRQLEENGLKGDQCAFADEALLGLISDYTHEAGVRELERQIGAICRAVAARVASGETTQVRVTGEALGDFLGPKRYVREGRLTSSRPGVATGLAYTPAGGEVLFIEATRYPGKGNLIMTGHIGAVMRESAQAALSLVRTRVVELGIDPKAFPETDVHVHVPSGAVPKDGPSAGVAMFTALASLFSDQAVRHDVAMTGEITLRGLVLPIGGLKEKSLAALRAGIKEVLIPKLNEKDLPDIPAEVKGQLRFVPVETVDQVLATALAPQFGKDEEERAGQQRFSHRERVPAA